MSVKCEPKHGKANSKEDKRDLAIKYVVVKQKKQNIALGHKESFIYPGQ